MQKKPAMLFFLVNRLLIEIIRVKQSPTLSFGIALRCVIFTMQR